MNYLEYIDINNMELLYRNNCKKLSNYFSTLKFLYKSQKNEKNNLLIRKNNDELKIIKMLGWFLLKYFLITHEISRTRKKIIFMMYNKDSSRLDEIEFENILSNASNLWLDQSYFKIKLLKDYCDTLLSDPYMCSSICKESGMSREEYYEERDKALIVMVNSYEKYLKEYWESQKKTINKLHIPTRVNYSEQAKLSLENYNRSFDDDTLLNKEEDNNV